MNFRVENWQTTQKTYAIDETYPSSTVEFFFPFLAFPMLLVCVLSHNARNIVVFYRIVCELYHVKRDQRTG